MTQLDARQDEALARLRAVTGSDFAAYLEATARAAAAGVTPWQLDLLARSTAAGPIKTQPTPATDQLPLLCRLRRHHWRMNPVYGPVTGGWTRKTCPRCAHLNVPTPDQR